MLDRGSTTAMKRRCSLEDLRKKKTCGAQEDEARHDHLRDLLRVRKKCQRTIRAGMADLN